MLALAAGMVEGGVFVWLPAYAFGMFDEHMVVDILLPLYSPFVIVPLLCVTVLLLRPETPLQRLVVPLLMVAAFACAAASALAEGCRDSFQPVF